MTTRAVRRAARSRSRRNRQIALAVAIVAILIGALLTIRAIRRSQPVMVAPTPYTSSSQFPATDTDPPSATPTKTPTTTRSPTSTGTITVPPVANPLSCRLGSPKRMVFPSLGVDASIEKIGLDPDAKPDSEGKQPLGNPKDRTKAGWYSPGPKPGSGTGTVIANGHTYRNGSAIFRDDFASKIREGQLIHFVMDNGSICSYRIDTIWPRVENSKGYPNLVRSENLYNFTGPERLLMMTCGGTWNSAAQDYDHLSVLVAEPWHR